MVTGDRATKAGDWRVRLAAALRRGPLAQGGLAVLVATAGLNLLNFTFQAVVGRLLGPALYGELTPITNVAAVLSLPLAALQVAVVQAVATRLQPDGSVALGNLARRSLLFGAIAAVAWLSFVPVVDQVLHLPSAVPAALLALWLLPMVPATVFQGALLAQRRYRGVAAGQFFGAGVVRLIAGITLVAVGFGIAGAVAATALGALATLLILALFERGKMSPRAETVKIVPGDALRSIIALSGVSVLTAIDAWLARHFLSSSLAGYFNAGSTAGRIALFAPGAITLVVFPRLVAVGGRGPQARRDLKSGALYVALVSVGAAVALAAFATLVIQVLFGAAFLPSAHVLPIIAFADASVALLSLLTYFFLARRSRWALVGWAGCAMAGLLSFVFHSSTRALAFDMLVSNTTALTVAAAAAIWQLAHEVPEPSTNPEIQGRISTTMSAIIPARNEAARIADCITSLRRALEIVQLPDAGEIIVVDDASTDSTSDVATAAGAVVLVQPRRRGPLAAWVRGVQRATGSILIFVDADCQISPSSLAALVGAFDDQQIGVVAARSSPLQLPYAKTLVWRSARFSALLLHEIKSRLTDHDFLPIGRLMAVRREAWRIEDPARAPCDRHVASLAREAGWKLLYEPNAVVGYEPLTKWDQLEADYRRTVVRSHLRDGYQRLPMSALVPAALASFAASPINALAWAGCRARLRLRVGIDRHRGQQPDLSYWDAAVDLHDAAADGTTNSTPYRPPSSSTTLTPESGKEPILSVPLDGATKLPETGDQS